MNKMSGTGHVAIPQEIVDDDRELLLVQFEYGRDAVRSGFRVDNRDSTTSVTVQNNFCGDLEGTEYQMKCGPFRQDFYTAPLWYPIKDYDYTQLPPR